MKVFRIDDGGFIWEFPAEVVAKNRATYYAERDKDTSYDAEFEFAMGDNHELKDWFFGNMDWDDVSGEAKLVATPAPLSGPRLNHEDLHLKIVTRDAVSGAGESNG